MEEGLIFALLAAVCFGGSQVFVRRGIHQAGESLSATLISTFTGMLLVSFLLLFTAEWDKIWSLSWQGFVLLGTAGVIHFVAGRFLNYSCIRLIGANRASAITRTSLFYAVILGIIFLNELLTAFIILGVLCIAGGATLVSIEKEEKISKMRGKGILHGQGAAFCWGISAVLIKPGIEEIGSPLAATFISYVTASLLLAGLLLGKRHREQLIQFSHVSLAPLVIAGIFVSIAQLTRYIALSYSPVSVVQPLLGTNVLFTLLFSFLLNRKLEVFTWKVFTGMLATVVGAYFFFC